ncbi:WD40-repeat-containing domain protein [Cyathus striatus]|nr:WD40-repeat-containing domain protein [Cyathus striatus]
MSIQADLPKFNTTQTLSYHMKPINVLKLSPDASKLLSRDDGMVVIWDVMSRISLEKINLVFHGPVSSAIWMPSSDGTTCSNFAVGSSDGSIMVYRHESSKYVCKSVTEAHENHVEDLAFDRYGQCLASIGDGHLLVWMVNHKGNLDEYAGTLAPDFKHRFCSITFHDDGKQILYSILEMHEIGHAVMSGKEMHVSNLFNGVDTYALPPSQPLKTYEHPISRNYPMHLACGQQGSPITAGSNDGFLRVFSHFRNMQTSLPYEKNILTQIVNCATIGSICIIATGLSEADNCETHYPIKLWNSTSAYTMAKDNCALNQDGSLKDASQIQWYFDPDDEVPQPQQRKTFLDLEAQVGSDSEDEDDEEQLDKFIVDNKDDDEDPNIPKLSAISMKISKHNITHHSPVAQDWSFYDVPVKNRSEEWIVYQLNLHAGPKHVQSAFSLSIIPGHIYVEALNLERIKKCTKIFGKVDQSHIRCAPNIMWDTYLGNIGASYTPYKHTWEVNSDKYYQVEGIPTMEELRSFDCCSHIPKEVLEQTRRAVLSANIHIRDQVKVVLQGIVSLAFVKDITEENATIRLFHSPDDLFEYPLNLLEKCFKIGNRVRLKSSIHKGVVGMVTSVEACGHIGEENITVVTFPLKKGKHIPVHSSDLDFCSEVHRNSTFRWEDSNDASTADASGSRTVEDRLMHNDPYRSLYGLYGMVTSGPQKGDIGILKSVNANGCAELEVEAHLISTGKL